MKKLFSFLSISQKGRFRVVDGVRALSLIVVVLGHLFHFHHPNFTMVAAFAGFSIFSGFVSLFAFNQIVVRRRRLSIFIWDEVIKFLQVVQFNYSKTEMINFTIWSILEKRDKVLTSGPIQLLRQRCLSIFSNVFYEVVPISQRWFINFYKEKKSLEKSMLFVGYKHLRRY